MRAAILSICSAKDCNSFIMCAQMAGLKLMSAPGDASVDLSSHD